MANIEWQYELDGVWMQIDPDHPAQNERIYQAYLRGMNTYGIVCICFSNGWKAGIDFRTMQTYCLNVHADCPPGHNVFRVRRLDRSAPRANVQV